MNVTVIGSGNGGMAVGFDWAQHGHRVTVYSQAAHADNIAAVRAKGGISSRGRLEGFAPLAYAGTDIVASLLNLLLACGMIGRWGAPMMPIRGQNNVQGASDVGAIPFAYTDYRPVTDPANRRDYARAWGVPEASLSLRNGVMVTEMTQPGSGVRGVYVMGENPVLSDPDISHSSDGL